MPRLLVAAAAAALLLLCSASGASAASDAYKSFQLVKPFNDQRVAGKTWARTAISKKLVKQVWGVEFWIDGQRVGVDRKAPYAVRINTRRFTDGEHVLRASLLVKKKGTKGPNRQICEYMRSIYVRIANGKLGRHATSAAKKKKRATTKTPAVPTAIAGGKKKWALAFNDNFDGTTLDASKWSSQRDDWLKGGHPYNDREDAWYLPENVGVGGGSLIQTIRQQPFDEFALTTGMVNSNHKFYFKYGYVEARVKVPACSGCWPVFWTLPEGIAWPPELDLFEFMHVRGEIQPRPFFASHWMENGVQQSNLEYFTVPCGTATNYTGKYHTYGFLWTPNKIQPYLDGVPGPVFTGAAVPQVSMYLILSLSVADGLVPSGSPQMRTDYIRVWQQQQ